MAMLNNLAEKHKNLVIQILLYDDNGDAYNEMMFETAMDYLNRYLDHDHERVIEFAKHKQFWNWWKQQYALIDESWLAKFGLIIKDQDKLHETYVNMHMKIDKDIDKVVWEIVWEASNRITSKDESIEAKINTP
jgi:hypothetical protein